MRSKLKILVSLFIGIVVVIVAGVYPHSKVSWISLIPPLLAIFFAWAWQRVLTGMFAGLFAGALILANFNLIKAIKLSVWDFLLQPAISPDMLKVFLFTLLLGGMVGIMVENGSVHDLVKRLSKFAIGRRTVQVIIGILGVLVFFDDYANTMVVGTASRPLTDRFNISREKLAYLVDSTAAPVASLALISTWIGIETQYLQAQIDLLHPIASSGYGVFIQLIPYRLYCIFTLIFLFIIASTGRDFGPMLEAEKRAIHFHDTQDDTNAISGHYMGAVLPVVVVLLMMVVLSVISGMHNFKHHGSGFHMLIQAFIHVKDSSMLLVIASFIGLIVALGFELFFIKPQKHLFIKGTFRGMKMMLPALALLVMAQGLRVITDPHHLNTPAYIIGFVDTSRPYILPMLVFITSAFTAFATGTSWGTMGILIPIVVPLAVHTVGKAHAPTQLVLMSIAAVLDGAVFGDHCSPISDTTVMSSIGSGCNHLSHVKTQLPYAVTAMITALIFGYIMIPILHTMTFLSYLFGTAFILTIVFILGKKAFSM